jgi:hypothetical protein
MLRKFVEAMRLWCTNFVLIASIILTVWLPGNVLEEYLAWYVPSDDDFVRSCRDGSMIETVFGPIYSGALVYALAQLKEGRRPSYLEAISVGLRTWGRLCSARFFAGLLILFGLILLVMVYAVVQIVIFLYYWQATRPEGVEPEPGFTPVEAPGQSYRFREDVKTAY